MGCWNGTCFLTQLPILAGENVRLVFIVESPYKNLKESQGDLAGYCYTTGQYFPRGLPIRGEYNDYGSIENVDASFALECMLKSFKDDCISVAFDAERDKYVDRNSLNPDKITLDYLLDRAQEGALNVYDGYSDKLSKYEHEKFMAKIKNAAPPEKPIIDDRRKLAVGYVLVREDMYQAILNSVSSDKAISRKIFHENAKVYLEKLRKYKKEITDDLNAISSLRKLIRGFDYMYDLKNPNIFCESLSKINSIPFQRNLSDFDSFIHEQLEAGMMPDDPKIIGLIDELADFMFFSFCLSKMRKGWCPQAGSGSQSDDVEVHASLAEATLKYVNEIRAQRKRY